MNPQIQTVAPAFREAWFSPAECQQYYRRPYSAQEIQIHWWGDPSTKPNHDGIVEFLRVHNDRSTNYVASAGRVTRMVGEENCALTTESGNPIGIKIECSCYCTDADYVTVAWLVADIWKRHGVMPLVGHNKYWATTCPGNWDLNRLTALAKQIYNNGGNTVNQEQARDMAFWGRLAANNSVDQANANSANDTNQIVSNPAYAGALMKQLYQGNELIRWKANNYDKVTGDLTKQLEDVRTALQDAQNKPPEVVIKEVQKACEAGPPVPVVPGSTPTPQPADDGANWFIKLLASIIHKG